MVDYIVCKNFLCLFVISSQLRRCHLDLCVKMERKQVGRERRHARSVQII
jgi:hypothetical protein